MEQQGQGPMMTSQGQVITSIGMGGGGTVTMAPNGIFFMIFFFSFLFLVKVAKSQQIFSICFHLHKMHKTAVRRTMFVNLSCYV